MHQVLGLGAITRQEPKSTVKARTFGLNELLEGRREIRDLGEVRRKRGHDGSRVVHDYDMNPFLRPKV